MKKISELKFGFPDAENYKRREHKELFNKIFYRNSFLEELCKPEISFLIGDKGTGKTAYSLFLSNNRYKNNIAVTKFIRETDYVKFISLKKEKNLQLSDYNSIWKVILLLLLSEHIYEAEKTFLEKLKNFKKFDYLHKAIEEYYYSAFSPEIINAIQFVESSNISAELISKYANLVGEENTQYTFNEKRFQVNLKYIENKFKNALLKIKLEYNHILFIDGIDIRPDNISYDDYLECIKGLANATWELNMDFFSTIKDSKGRLRIVLLLRPDIFESLGLQNLNTKIRSNSVLLNWVTDYKQYEDSNIFLLIDNLLKVQQTEKLDKGEAWQYYFPYDAPKTEHIKQVIPNKYTSFIEFLRYSFYRPRDIITMLEFLKRVTKNENHFTRENFENPIFKRDLSEYMLGEIKDQLLFFYQLDEYEIFLKFFEFLNGKPSFTYKEYLEIFRNYTKYIDSISAKRPKFTQSANEFLQFLYDLNIICYIEYSKDKKNKFFHWCFKEKTYSNFSPKVKENREYQIFYSLTKALKIGKEYA
jgi:archaellum biogenesis ATPase FlaH